MSFISLPDDVLRYTLLPLLSNVDRIHIALAVPRSHQTILKISKRKILDFELHIMSVRETRRCSDIFYAPSVYQKMHRILTWYTQFGNYVKILQHSRPVRDLFIEKLNHFAGPNENQFKTADFKYAIQIYRANILHLLRTEYPLLSDEKIYRSGKIPTF